MKTKIDINDLVQVPDTPLYQSRTTGEYFIRDADTTDTYIQIPTEKIDSLRKLGINIPDVAAELESHNKPRHEYDEHAKTNNIIRKIVKSNNSAEMHKTQRDLQRYYQEIAKLDRFEQVY